MLNALSGAELAEPVKERGGCFCQMYTETNVMEFQIARLSDRTCGFCCPFLIPCILTLHTSKKLCFASHVQGRASGWLLYDIESH
jgi:hypothetical protein